MNEKIRQLKKKMKLHPIMVFAIMILITIIVSGVMSWVGVESSYIKINPSTLEQETIEVSVESLFSLSGIKYIFSNTVSNFVNFAPLSMLLIIFVGIGIMDSSGFLKTFFTVLTQNSKKNSITFVFIFICMLASIMGDISYIIFLPIGALLFKYGKRNPIVGLISSFAALSCGTGINIFINSIDSSLITYTETAAKILDKGYDLTTMSFIFIMLVLTIIMTFVLTFVTEKVVAPRLGKFGMAEIDEQEEKRITKKELRGLVLALLVGIAYLLFFVYNIIPGLPLSGNLLDYSEINYIDKLFGYNSFFNQGYVFIITIFFFLLGFFFGLGSRTIKNNKDVSNFLGHSLDDIGKVLVLILFAATFISIFKKTNIGTVIVSMFSNLIVNSNFTGIPLIFLLLIISMISTIFLPSSVSKWAVLSSVVVPTFMNAGLSPEFSQIIFRAGECITIGLTPLLAYFVIYLGLIDKYNESETPIGVFKSFKYILPYAIATFIILFVFILGWYIIGLPMGIGSSPVI